MRAYLVIVSYGTSGETFELYSTKAKAQKALSEVFKTELKRCMESGELSKEDAKEAKRYFAENDKLYFDITAYDTIVGQCMEKEIK